MIKLTNQRDPRKKTPCFVITKGSLDVSLNTIKEQLSSHFTELENKIEQITKIAKKQLRIDLQSQIDQLNINLKNTIKIKIKTRENIRKTIMEDVTKVLCEILKDIKITLD